MPSTIRKITKAVFRKPSIALANFLPNGLTLETMRRLSGIQLSRREISDVLNAIRANRHCKLLVFGLGNDSLFWTSANRNGRTAFVEDDVEWIETIRQRDGISDIHSVKYETRLRDWRNYLSSNAAFDLEFPKSISDTQWDVILVDGPAAWCEEVPGRMKSIAASTRLIRDQGHIFVHDYNREPEKELADNYLKLENMVGRSDNLAHFEYKKQPL